MEGNDTPENVRWYQKVGGFAIGLATCIVIALFIRNELSYGKLYANKSIYRLYNDWRGPDTGRWTSFPANIHTILKNDYPEVETAARLIPYKWFYAGSNLIRRDDRADNTYEEGFAYADNDLLKILDIEMIYGSQSNALVKPRSIILSKKMADKYFPNEDPVGKIIILNEDKTCSVSNQSVPHRKKKRETLSISLTTKNERTWKRTRTKKRQRI